MKNLIVFILLVSFVTIGGHGASGQSSTAAFELASVVDVIDGDTIEVSMEDGTIHRVRYIGINTPERDQPCGDDATYMNTLMVDGQTVAMFKDVSETDRYGRLLRYVFVNGTFVNAALVADGWAESARYPPDTIFAEWFDYLHEQARAADLGCHPFGVFEGAGAVSPTATIVPAATGVTVTAASDVNLRGGPGTNYSTIGTLRTNQTATAIARNGDWLLLDNGAWVASWIVSVDGDYLSLPTQGAPAAPAQQPAVQQPQQSQPQATAPPQAPSVPPTATQPPPPAAPAFTCDCSKVCSAMASCDEAYFQLNQCGCGARDGDNDGVPCESICPGG